MLGLDGQPASIIIVATRRGLGGVCVHEKDGVNLEGFLLLNK